MTDPFDDLRDVVGAAAPAPDPEFAAGLRTRLERALDLPMPDQRVTALPKGVVPVTATDLETPQSDVPARGVGAAVPYLAVSDARGAIDWYVDIFGARLVGEPIVMPDGRIGHSELAVSAGMMYLADAHPEIGVTAPRPNESPVSLMLAVDDADDVRTRAVAAGAVADREPYDAHGQRNAWIVDPFGHRWGLNSPLRTRRTSAATRYRYDRGDLGYASMTTPDADRAARFYTDVLGWTYDDTTGHRVGGTPDVGFRSGSDRPTLGLVFAVDDLDAAVDRVRVAGGRVSPTDARPYGTVADCEDDQGTNFGLWQQRAEDAAGQPRPPANGSEPGDLSYLTLEVVDSAKARAFYGAVLGWTFTPGRIEDGWQVDDSVPMTGFSGGHDRATAVPMWRVGDIDEAVATVRTLGGVATDAQHQPYGRTSECTDDQGIRFYLGEVGL